METNEHTQRITTPIVFLVFNRPEPTQRVFDAIKKAQPNQLFVIADGPRHNEDKPKCEAVRAILKQIDWDCNIQTLFREKNLGCRKSVSSGITWAFKHVDRAIILEDDTIPHETFFPYCTELLERYKDDRRIMNISGVNFSNANIKESYYFSRIPQIWGWATWKRAWKHYDVDMKSWPRARESKLLTNIFGDSAVAKYWDFLFEQLYSGKIKKSAWDAQWVFACMNHQGLSINPAVNLVTNIGFGEDATRSTSTTDPLAHRPAHPLAFPLAHPKEISVNTSADTQTMKTVFRVNNSLKKKLRWLLKSNLPFVYSHLKKLYTK